MTLIKELYKDLALMPAFFHAWRKGHVWFEPSQSDHRLCVHAHASSRCALSGLAFQRLSRRLERVIDGLMISAAATAAVFIAHIV